MTNDISMGIGLAGLPSDVDVSSLKRFLAENSDGYEVYTLAPVKPGHMRAAAFDIMLILYAAGSVASLAALLWMAYDKFIAPKNLKIRILQVSTSVFAIQMKALLISGSEINIDIARYL